MNTRVIAMIIAAATVLASGVMAEEAQAGKAKGKMGQEKRAEMLKQFDTNKDGKLCADEKAAMKEARKQKMAETVKQFDKDGDGKLNDEEKKAMIEARKNQGQGRKAKAKGKGKAKAGNE